MKARLVKFGEIEVEGKRYTHDVVIEGGKVRKRKKRPSKQFREKFGHTPLSAGEEIPSGGKRLILGTGSHGALPVMDEALAEAKRRGVEVIAAPTLEACQLLEEVKKGQAYAILHLYVLTGVVVRRTKPNRERRRIPEAFTAVQTIPVIGFGHSFTLLDATAVILPLMRRISHRLFSLIRSSGIASARRACTFARSISSVRLIPSGVMSNAHAKIKAIGNPVINRTIIDRNAHGETSNTGNICVTTCATSQAATA
jgi:hypothetical protein